MNVVEAVREAWIKEAEAAIPDPPYCDFVSYEDWSRAFHLRERLIGRLLAERLREPTPMDAPAVPAMPDNMVSNSATREAWAAYYGSPRPPREPAPAPIRYRPKPSRMRPGSEDISSWPEGLLP